MGKDILANYLGKLFDTLGIHPIDGVALGFILILLFSRKDIKRWDQLPGWRKAMIINGIIGVAVFGILSLLRLLGFIEL